MGLEQDKLSVSGRPWTFVPERKKDNGLQVDQKRYGTPTSGDAKGTWLAIIGLSSRQWFHVALLF